MKFGWKELRFQVSIPNNGLPDNIINKVRTLVGNGFWVDGYITVDFEQYRDFLEMWKCCFSRLFFQPLAVPQHHYLYKNTLNSCSKK